MCSSDLLEPLHGGGSSRRLVKPKPRPEPEPEPEPEADDDKSGRFIGICLVAPVMGQMFCWRG